MFPRFSRRKFLAGSSGLAVMSLVPVSVEALFEPMYPPTDLSFFEKPISAGPAAIRFGYAAIAWGDNDRQAIEEISAVGFRGIQLLSNGLREFGGKPGALRELLHLHDLSFIALSSEEVGIEPGLRAEQIARCTSHAKFVRDCGGLYLQIIDKRPEGRSVGAADYRQLGTLLTEIGKRSADMGVTLGYHHHVGSIGEHPDEIDRVLDASDPRYVKLVLDVAHYFQGGGDPAKAIERHHDRLLYVHIKDVERKTPTSADADPFEFVELGRGQVNLPAVFEALQKTGFRGWAVVELDNGSRGPHSPKESAILNKKYIEEKLGYGK